MGVGEITIEPGFGEGERPRVGELYWEAFGDKLSAAFRCRSMGARVVTAALRVDRVMVAREAGDVVGACGYRRGGRGATDVSWRRLRRDVPGVETLWALAVLSLLNRRERPGVLVLDGICVGPSHRGRGIGTRLLDAMVEHAREQNAHAVQLSVVDTNPRAAALYRRHGFAPVDQGSLGPLRRLYGFDHYTTMRKQVEA